MGEIRDITDKSPNEDLIALLEEKLELAKAGEIRTVLLLTGDAEDKWLHDWVMDERNCALRMTGALSMMQFDVLTGEHLQDENSYLSQALDDLE